MQQDGRAGDTLKRHALSRKIFKGEFWGQNGLKQPSFDFCGQVLRRTDGCRRRRRLWQSVECFKSRRGRTFFNEDPVIRRQIAQLLHQPAWPADGGSNRAVRVAQAKEYLFTVLRKKARSRL